MRFKQSAFPDVFRRRTRVSGWANDPTDAIKKAVEKSALDQAGTKPFHLKAEIAPSFDRDKDSGRTSEDCGCSF
jgi:hypothetical protein